MVKNIDKTDDVIVKEEKIPPIIYYPMKESMSKDILPITF